MKAYRICLLAVLFLALSVPRASACGFCIEDKIAAVYDNAIVTQALAQKHQVVFCSISGVTSQEKNLGHTISAMLDHIAGIDPANTKISPAASADALTVAFTFDPTRASLDGILNSVREKLSKKGLTLEVLRTMKTPAELDAAK